MGENIDENAQAAANAGNNVATFGWAFAGAAWNALGAESVSQVADKGWSGTSTGDKIMAVIAVATLGKGEEAATVAKETENAVEDIAKDVQGITTAYKRPSGATTGAQRASVQDKPCVDCGSITSRQVADHKTPLVKEYYETGTIDKQNMRSPDAVQPQCPACSASQGGKMSQYSKQQKQDRGL